MTYINKVVFVSGVGGDIGFAAATAFAKAGASVALTDIDDGAATLAAEELTRRGHRALAIHCDVTDEASVANAIKHTVAKLGWLDAAYNDSGLDVPSAETADASADDFDRAIAVNLKGVWLLMKHQLRRMREQGSGAIVNCTSPSGLAGIAGLAAYTAAKHGVIGITRAAALEYARKGIRINAICPDTDGARASGAIRKLPDSISAVGEGYSLGRIASAAETVLWLCGPRARFMIGQVVATNATTRPDRGTRSPPRADSFMGPYRPLSM